jgi:DNA segregation ATPase FtsK/SpoIIIE, S-DNA-T family
MSSITGQQRLFSASLEARLRGSLGRAGGFALGVGVCALWLSVITWSSADPSLTHATGEAARNWLGGFGAVVSDLLLEASGLAAVAVLMVPLFWALELVASERISGFGLKSAYFPFSIILLSGALSALPVSAAWPLGHGYGGILGDLAYDFVTKVLAFVNPDRAGLLAGLLFVGAGLSVMGQAIGLTSRDVAALVRRRGPSVSSGGGWRAGFRALTDRLAGGEPQDFDYGRPSMGATDRPRWPEQAHVRTRVPVEPHLPGWDARPFDNAEDFYALGRAAAPFDLGGDPLASMGGFPGDHEGVGPGSHMDIGPDGALVDEDEHSSRAIAQRFAPARPAGASVPLTGAHGSGGGQNVGFNVLTEESSRAIAERFAPQGVRASRAVDVPPQPLSPASLKAQFLGSSPFRAKKDVSYKRPSLSVFDRMPHQRPAPEISQTVMRGNARLLEDVLQDFGVKGEVRDIRTGPVVTVFEFEPARGTKTARVVALADDIARSMNVRSVRIGVVPGRNAIGIELPNSRRDAFSLRDILDSDAWHSPEGALPLALGKSITGEAVVADLARMPHLLIAGTTGSGKSVGLNAMIVSLLMRHSPEDCRLLMIDPKMLELSVYNGIPHLLSPVVTEPQKAVAALNWAVAEMEERYKRLAKTGSRNIEAFNARVKSARNRGETISRTVQTGFDPNTGQALYEREEIKLETMPYLVVVVDEFADLMIAAGKEIEIAVQRLAQKARAAGIHLIMATQRPSVDIITGTIKANFPTRISFKVASKIDSRTILNEQGAEHLLGHGDMLFTTGAGQMARVHGALVGDEEVERIVQHLCKQGRPQYVEGIADTMNGLDASSRTEAPQGSPNDLYDRAVAIVLCDRKASTSYIQRRLSIGYNRAADLIERMEHAGLVSAPNQSGRREVLAGEPVSVS